MYETLLDVAIPNGLTLLGSVFRGGGARAEKVVLLQQIYANENAQENLRSVCKLFAEQAGVRLIAVEGTEGAIAPNSEATSVASLLQRRCVVSAGVEVLLNVDRLDVEAWGVDDLDAEARSREAMERVNVAAIYRDRFFSVIRRHLRTAQKHCYLGPVAELRRSQLALYGQWELTRPGSSVNYAPNLSRSMNKVVAKIKKAATVVGLDLRGFPLIALFDALQQQETHFSQKKAMAQQREFLKRLGTEIVSRMDGEQGIDLDKAEPIIQFWMHETKLSGAELSRIAEVRGLDVILGECFQWIVSWIAERGRVSQMGQSQGAAVAEELMRLAIRLGTPFFDLREFRNWVAYCRRATQVTAAGLISQISECCQLIVRKIGNRDALRLLEVEERLELLYRALRLELVPAESEAAEVGPGAIARLMGEVCDITRFTRSGVSQMKLELLDEGLSAANEFYERSRHRGRIMAERTLELMRKRGEDRALLVAGGFHERSITRTLENYRPVSWSVLTPTPVL